MQRIARGPEKGSTVITERIYGNTAVMYRKFGKKCAYSFDYEILSKIPSLDLKDEMEDVFRRFLLA